MVCPATVTLARRSEVEVFASWTSITEAGPLSPTTSQGVVLEACQSRLRACTDIVTIPRPLDTIVSAGLTTKSDVRIEPGAAWTTCSVYSPTVSVPVREPGPGFASTE